MTQYEIESLWSANELNVAYSFSDRVRVKTGKQTGQTGRIVALFTLEPFPTYVIELSNGGSIVAMEPALETSGMNDGSTLVLIKP
jgi:hypothetical protein